MGRFKKLICVVLIFGTLAMSIEANTAFALETNTCPKEIVNFIRNELGMSITVFEGREAKDYLKLVHKYKFAKIRENIFSDNVLVMEINPQNYIFIVGEFKNDRNKILYAVINGNTSKVVMISISTFKKDGQVNIKIYDANGFAEEINTTTDEIIHQSEENKRELLDFIKQYNSEKTSTNQLQNPETVKALISIPTNWEYWACKFAGYLACSTACMMFVELPPIMLTCRWACSYFWGKGLCNNYR